MPKRKTPELKPEEQFKRFVDAAKATGAESRMEQVERDFKNLSAPKKSVPKKGDT
jgi:hypothetical protein